MIQRAGKQNESTTRIHQNGAQTSSWLICGKRQKCTTGFKNGEKCHDQLNGALQAHRHDPLGAHPLIHQVVSQLVGAGIEFGIGELLFLEEQGNGIGRAIHLLLKQLMHAEIGHLNNRPLLPTGDPLALGLRKQVERIGRSIRGLHHRSQQDEDVTGEPLDAISIEQIRGVGDRGAQALIGTPAEIEGEIELGGITPGGQDLRRKAIELL